MSWLFVDGTTDIIWWNCMGRENTTKRNKTIIYTIFFWFFFLCCCCSPFTARKNLMRCNLRIVIALFCASIRQPCNWLQSINAQRFVTSIFIYVCTKDTQNSVWHLNSVLLSACVFPVGFYHFPRSFFFCVFVLSHFELRWWRWLQISLFFSIGTHRTFTDFCYSFSYCLRVSLFVR